MADRKIFEVKIISQFVETYVFNVPSNFSHTDIVTNSSLFIDNPWVSSSFIGDSEIHSISELKDVDEFLQKCRDGIYEDFIPGGDYTDDYLKSFITKVEKKDMQKTNEE